MTFAACSPVLPSLHLHSFTIRLTVPRERSACVPRNPPRLLSRDFALGIRYRAPIVQTKHHGKIRQQSSLIRAAMPFRRRVQRRTSWLTLGLALEVAMCTRTGTPCAGTAGKISQIVFLAVGILLNRDAEDRDQAETVRRKFRLWRS